ncbi:hypothetical protein [Streptomyces sp. NPDC059009]|uniref:hypothetical protein n=1 Tax=Streptomyces sp. NPDC059009 TaxID=3346694 RepID=UPI003682CC33
MANEWNDWISVYERAYRAPLRIAEISCPNCRCKTLELVFTEKLPGRIGYASFWCNTCMFGIHLSRTEIPEDAEVIPALVSRTSDREHDGATPDNSQPDIPKNEDSAHEKRVGDYTPVWPDTPDSGDESEDTESEVF